MSGAESAVAVSAFVYASRSSGALAAEPLGSSRIDRVVGPWPKTLMEMAESHHKGWRLAGTPLSPLGKWRRGYGDKEASVRIHFPKGGGGRYLT